MSSVPALRPGVLMAIAYGLIPFIMVWTAAELTAWPRLLAMCLFLAVGWAMVFRRATGVFGSLPRPLLLAFALYTGWGAVGILGAHNWFYAAFDTARSTVFLGWLLLLAWLIGQDRRHLRNLFKVLAMATVLQALVGLGQLYADLFMGIPPGTYPPFGFMASSNYYGEAMLLLLVPAVGCALLNGGIWRWIGWGASVLALVAALSAHARSVQLALVAVAVTACLCVWALRLSRRDRKELPWWLRARVRWGLLALLMLGMGAGGYVRWQDKFAMTVQEVRTINDSEGERIVIWKESLRMTREHPVLGVGAGNWKFHVLERGAVSSFQGFATRYFVRAHNDFLQAFAERGIPGGLAFLGVWVLGIWYGIRKVERAADREDRLVGSLALSGLVGWAVIASFGFPMERTAICAFWLLLLAMAGGKSSEEAKVKEKAPGRLAAGLLIVFSLAFGVLMVRVIRADEHARIIALAKNAQDWYTVNREAKAADRWYYPCHSLNNTPIEWYMGTAILLRGDQAGAFPYLQTAYHKHPWHPHVVSNYAATLYGQGKELEARTLMEDLLLIYPEFHDLRRNLNEVYMNSGNWNKVKENLTFWEEHVKPRDISLYLEQVKSRLESNFKDTTFQKFN